MFAKLNKLLISLGELANQDSGPIVLRAAFGVNVGLRALPVQTASLTALPSARSSEARLCHQERRG